MCSRLKNASDLIEYIQLSLSLDCTHPFKSNAYISSNDYQARVRAYSGLLFIQMHTIFLVQWINPLQGDVYSRCSHMCLFFAPEACFSLFKEVVFVSVRYMKPQEANACIGSNQIHTAVLILCLPASIQVESIHQIKRLARMCSLIFLHAINCDTYICSSLMDK